MCIISYPLPSSLVLFFSTYIDTASSPPIIHVVSLPFFLGTAVRSDWDRHKSLPCSGIGWRWRSVRVHQQQKSCPGERSSCFVLSIRCYSGVLSQRVCGSSRSQMRKSSTWWKWAAQNNRFEQVVFPVTDPRPTQFYILSYILIYLDTPSTPCSLVLVCSFWTPLLLKTLNIPVGFTLAFIRLCRGRISIY